MSWCKKDKNFTLKINTFKDILKIVGLAVCVLTGEVKLTGTNANHVTGVYPIILSKAISNTIISLAQDTPLEASIPVQLISPTERNKVETSMSYAIALFKVFVDHQITFPQKIADLSVFAILERINRYLESKGYKQSISVLFLTQMLFTVTPQIFSILNMYSPRKLLSLALFLAPIGIATKLISKEVVEVPVLIPMQRKEYTARYSKYVSRFNVAQDTFIAFQFINLLLPVAIYAKVTLLLTSIVFFVSYLTTCKDSFRKSEIYKHIITAGNYIKSVRPGQESITYLNNLFHKMMVSSLPIAIASILYPVAISLYTHVNVVLVGVTIPSIIQQYSSIEREFKSFNLCNKNYYRILNHTGGY